MADYDLLAPHYDAVTGDSATEAAFTHDIIERRQVKLRSRRISRVNANHQPRAAPIRLP